MEKKHQELMHLPAGQGNSGSNQQQEQQQTVTTYTVGFHISDADGNVSGIKMTLTDTTDSTKTFESSNSGGAGGCTVQNVPAGTYSATTSGNTGYEDYTHASNITVTNKDLTGTDVVEIVLTKTGGTSP